MDKQWKKIFLGFSILFVTIMASAQVESITNKFFKEYESSIEVALSGLYGTNRYFDPKKRVYSPLVDQLEETTQLLGEYYGFVKIQDAEFADCFKIVSYLVKYDRQPLRFTFNFYKADKTYSLYSFEYDDGFDDDFKELMKVQLGLNDW